MTDLVRVIDKKTGDVSTVSKEWLERWPEDFTLYDGDPSDASAPADAEPNDSSAPAEDKPATAAAKSGGTNKKEVKADDSRSDA